MKARTWMALAMAPLALAACSGDGGTGANGTGQVAVRFGVAGGASASKASAEGPRLATTGGPLVVTGANGTLSITNISVVVSRLKLKGQHDQACTTSQPSGENEKEAGECEFQSGPYFLTVPLDGSQLTVTTGAIPPGTYDRVRFKVKNLDMRDDDDHEDADATDQQAIAALFNQIRSQFPDWPAQASMRVTGTFTPTGGTARAFTAYLKAEAKIDLPINPPLTVADGSTTNTVAVLLDPASFFKVGSNVIDLSQFSASHVGDFEVEAENGFHGEGHHGEGGGHD